MIFGIGVAFAIILAIVGLIGFLEKNVNFKNFQD